MKCPTFHNGIFIDPQGKVKPCCRFAQDTGLIWNNNPAEILQSDFYKDLRQKERNNTRIDACNKCYAEDDAGFKSLRQRFIDKYPAPAEHLQYLELAFNNVCNLTCLGCEPKYSNLWGRKLQVPAPEIYNNITVSQNLEMLDYVSFFGGEPFATNDHIQFLESLINNDLAKNISIEYTTNCTIMPPIDWHDIMKQFKSCKIICSIDGVGKTNENIRTNSKWNKVMYVFDYFKSTNFIIEVNTVVMTENVFELPQLANWIDSQPISKWHCNVLTWPSELCISNLPKTQKDNLIEVIKNLDFQDKQFILSSLR